MCVAIADQLIWRDHTVTNSQFLTIEKVKIIIIGTLLEFLTIQQIW